MTARMTIGRALVVLLPLSSGMGCALLQKGDPVEPRYLTPSAAEASGPEAPAPNLALRLRSVRASQHLAERVVVVDGTEVHFLEERRWTRPPRAIVQERLAQELFERHGLTRRVGGAGMTLEVHVRAFELVVGDPAMARVELTCLLHDERSGLFQTTIAFEHPAQADTSKGKVVPGDDFAVAMGRALDEATAAVAERVRASLSAHLAQREEDEREDRVAGPDP